MKTVFFHWAKSPDNGPGIGRSFAPLINALRQTDEVEEYWVPHAGSNPLNMLRNIWFVRKHSTKRGVNHITGDIHYCVLGLVGRPSVLTVHDDYAMVTVKRGWWEKAFKYLFWMWLPVKLADKTLCISNATRDKVERYVKSIDMFVMPHHTVDPLFKPSPKEPNKECPRLLQLGSNRQKNLDTTIRAVAKLGRPCHLRVIKPMTEEQKALAASLGVDYSNASGLTDEEVTREFEAADIVLFPSLFEGFGMPPIEAQRVGRPVVTSDIEPMRSVAGGHTCAALLKDPTDPDEFASAIRRVLDDDEYRRGLIANGKKNAERYSLDETVKNFRHLYEVVARNKRKMIVLRGRYKLINFAVCVLPWPLKRFVLRHVYGYEIDRTARIGLSYVFPDHLVMGPHAAIGHMNMIGKMELLSMAEWSHIGHKNHITGHAEFTSMRHFSHDPGRRSEVVLGKGVQIMLRHHINCSNALHMGDYSAIAGYESLLMTHAADLMLSRQDSHPIEIGHHAFVSSRCVVLGGSKLPDCSILAAGGVLGKIYEEPFSLYGGVPAKRIKDIPRDAAYMNRNTWFVE